MGQAIETKYVGPTNHRGARVFVCDKKRTSVEKDKRVIEKNNNLIDAAQIESLIARYADGLAMDDAEDREAMALFIMERIVCPMRARLDALAKANKKFHGFMHADEVAAALFGE